jgi:hypothetical protein
VIQRNDFRQRFLAEELNRVLICEIITGTYRVRGMLLPGILSTKRGIDTSPGSG